MKESKQKTNSENIIGILGTVEKAKTAQAKAANLNEQAKRKVSYVRSDAQIIRSNLIRTRDELTQSLKDKNDPAKKAAALLTTQSTSNSRALRSKSLKEMGRRLFPRTKRI
ncbi:MAG: hypothetical protein M1503_05375 [Thaumarchaeota archaeon]|nr:hypothetical protein [Nitrososphaerota archaeon]MCL5317682.1 hypothetical protein [Nitrososphaerota archaeon]